MKIKRRIIVIVWTVLAAVCLCIFLYSPEGKVGLPSGHAELSFACDGEGAEEQFLVEQVDTVVDNGARRITSDDGFIVYRIAVGDAILERGFITIRQVGFHLEFSPDGDEWSNLMHFAKLGKRDTDRFHTPSCGFGRRKSRTGTAYFRFGPPTQPQEPHPAIKFVKLQVSGSQPPGFQTFSIKRKLSGVLPARLMVLVGLVPVIILRRWWKTPWRLFGAGALLWTVSVAAKVGFALLANKPVARMLDAALPAFPADLALWIYIGLLTGVFECGIFLLIAGHIRRTKWTWKEAVSLGVAFGAVEAIALGIVAAIAAAMSTGMNAPLDSFSFTGPVERVIALAVHTASVVMVIYALTQRKWKWFVASFLYKTAIDTVAAFIPLSGKALLEAHPWFVQLCLFGPFGYAGLCILALLWRFWPAEHDVNTLG